MSSRVGDDPDAGAGVPAQVVELLGGHLRSGDHQVAQPGRDRSRPTAMRARAWPSEPPPTVVMK